MIGTLLRKDFRRAWRNPWAWLLHLSLPLAITALIGLAFGGKGPDGSLAKIRLAVVDEDGALLGSLLRSAFSQGDAGRYFDPVVVGRDEAMRLLRDDQISAAVVLPENFTREYLSGKSGLALEVIKNPAQSQYPAIVEELAAVAVTGLNALSRNLRNALPELQDALTREFDFDRLSETMRLLGERTRHLKPFLTRPLLTYHKSELARAEEKKKGGLKIFAFILPGMASAFLLFLADHSMRDVHREERQRTLDRMRTMTRGVGVFVAGKVLFTGLAVLAGSAILFGAGTLIFGVDWGNTGLLALACAGYSIFAAGFTAMLCALAGNERRAEALNTIIVFGIAFAGGSYVSAELLPLFMREHICPLMPNYWFTQAVQGIASGEPRGAAALVTVLKLAAAGAGLALAAAILIQRRLTAGART